MSWTTPAIVRQFMGKGSAADDANIQRLIDAGAAFIETWTNRTFSQASYTETMDGNGKGEILLGNYPVTAVASVSVNGLGIDPVPAPNDFRSTGFMFDKFGVQLQGDAWFSKGRNNVVVQYTAGFAQIPLDLVQALVEVVALKIKQGQNSGLQSHALAGETITYVISDFPRPVQTLLNNYKRVVPHA